jgi:hypothetical protein
MWRALIRRESRGLVMKEVEVRSGQVTLREKEKLMVYA